MTAALTERGYDRRGTFATRPKDADDGCQYWATDYQRGFTFYNDGQMKVWVPDDGKTFYDASEAYFVDFFRGAALDNAYGVGKGNDAQAAYPVLDTDQMGGELDMVTGDAGTGTAADASALGLTATAVSGWSLTAGLGTRLGVRVKLSAITTVAAFIGLSDDDPATTLEMPISLSGTTFTSNASDALGLLFDTAATTDTIRLAAVAEDTDETAVDTSQAFVANTYVNLVLVVTPDGVVKAYYNDTLVGTLTYTGDTAATDLLPIMVVEARSTTSRTMSAKFWFCHQDG